MKKVLMISVMLAFISAVCFGEKVVAKGPTYSSFGNFKLIKVDEMLPFMGKDCQTFVIKYDNTPLEIRIIVCKEKNCRTYLVLSDKLSVQYVCRQEYFGVERIDKKYEAMGLRTVDTHLNRLEYFHQKVLNAGPTSEMEATSLIAAYFPMLLSPVSQS